LCIALTLFAAQIANMTSMTGEQQIYRRIASTGSLQIWYNVWMKKWVIGGIYNQGGL
jgi:hypothetical protein